MKKRLNICPFDYFWINCVVNDKLSIISSVEQSYETCGFLNDYRYSITGTSCWWRELMILPGDSLYNNLDVFQVNDLYINPDKIIEELISKLNMDCCISVLVDLYNWLPHSVNVVCHAKRKKLTSKIQKIRQGKQRLGGLKLYLNGFIKPFNQTIKHCFFVQTSLIGTKTASYALLCGVCTNHCNIDGNSLIANFLYKIQYKY